MRAPLFAVLVLSACASPAPPTPTPEAEQSSPQPPRELSPLAQQIYDELRQLDAELSAPGVVTAGFGQSADLGGGLIVSPYAVIEDSRCPGATACLWPGRMRIRASVAGQETELTLGRTLETQAGAVEFVAVSPGAWSEWPGEELGPRPAYRFGFRRR